MNKPVNKNHKISLVLGLFLIITCFVFISRLREAELPNIVLITVDALRADHLSCYGYQRKTSPNIDNLARQGVVFTNCFATSSATIYSSLGLFTGKYLATDKYEPSSWDNLLDAKFKTLAEYLKSFGYSTAALIAGNSNYAAGKGFQKGFDYYFITGKDAKELTMRAVELLNKHSKKKPFFLWLHYLDTHTPYLERPEYLKQFESDTLFKENDKILRVRPEMSAAIKISNEYSSNGYIPRVAFHKGEYSLNHYIACYDAQILYADFYIGELLKRVKDDTLVILSADHGESLGEHNTYFAHGENIYDEVLHIPLIIKDNRYFKPGFDSSVISAVDIVPTILSRINPLWYFLNKSKFDGLDLNSIRKPFNPVRKYIYSYFPWARSIRDVDTNVKYILSNSGTKELYILPDEYNNLIRDDLFDAFSKERLKNDLRDWLRHYPIHSDINAKKINLDQDTKDNLRSLGYLE